MKEDRKGRFSIWIIFGVMTALYLLGIIIEFVTLLIYSVENPEIRISNIMTVENLQIQVISLIFLSIFLTLSINTFYRYIQNKKKPIFFIKPIVIGIVAQIIYHCFMFFVLGDNNVILTNQYADAQDPLPVGFMAVSYVIAGVFFVSVALLTATLAYARDDRKQHEILREQKMQLEIENTRVNYNFLKAQINPHFLYNTLSFFYARSLPYSQELSEGILTLSDIMRYALQESIAIEGKAPLEKEVEHLRNVIKINQLRYSNQLKVDLRVVGDISAKKIIPFVLVTLVENALKHGNLKSEEHPIEFFLSLEEEKLYFKSFNQKKNDPEESSNGIGLMNMKKQLALAYKDEYQLNIIEEPEFYTTELTINPLI